MTALDYDTMFLFSKNKQYSSAEEAINDASKFSQQNKWKKAIKVYDNAVHSIGRKQGLSGKKMNKLLNEVAIKYISLRLDGKATSQSIKYELENLGAGFLPSHDLSRIFNERGAMYTNLGTEVWNLGKTWLCQQCYDFAHTDFSTSIALDPDNWRPYFNKANLYSRNQQNYQLSLFYYPYAAQLNPNYSEIFNNMGLAYASTQQYKEAIKYLEKAIELDPNKSDARDNLSMVRSQMF